MQRKEENENENEEEKKSTVYPSNSRFSLEKSVYRNLFT